MYIKNYKNLEDKSIYQVFVRNYSYEGTFKKVESDLVRIKNMGFDILYLLPVNEIGIKNRKGKLGSPYAIKDYRKINPELGTIEDFKSLINSAHLLGFKVMIDVVMNHTSPDSNYVLNHPEWFYKRDNNFANKVGDWSDIVDLDYSNDELVEDASNMLSEYVSLGIDGFRCDVASLVPMKFWRIAARKCQAINSEVFFLGESVESSFIEEFRSQNFDIETDNNLYETFDMLYEYDVFDLLKDLVNDEISLVRYSEIIQRQIATFKVRDLKVRYLENHDKQRAAKLITDLKKLENYLAYIMFVKGVAFVYNGQEYHESHRPSLFDKDTINLLDRSIDHSDLIKKLNEIRKMGYRYNPYKIIINDIVLFSKFIGENKDLVGIFNVKRNSGKFKVDLKDGFYLNLIDNNEVVVINSEIILQFSPIIIEVEK